LKTRAGMGGEKKRIEEGPVRVDHGLKEWEVPSTSDLVSNERVWDNGS